MRTCTRCQKTQDLSKEFSHYALPIMGQRLVCRTCFNNDTRKYYEKNKEKRKKQMRAYSNKTKELRRKIALEYYYNNQDLVRAKQKDYYKKRKVARNLE